MPVVGSGDRDRVHVLLLKNVAKVLVGRRSLTHLLLRRIGKLLKNVAVHIADVRDPCSILVRLKRRKVSISTPMETDHRKVEPIIRAHNLAVALGRRSDRQPSRAYRKCVEKLTPCNHFSLLGNIRPIVCLTEWLFSTDDKGIPLVKTLATEDKSVRDAKKSLNRSGTASCLPS